MRLTKTYLLYVCAATAVSLTAVTADATGFDLPDQDAFVIGRGMAFVATADNPSAIYYNPAGISQLQGNNVRVGVYGVYLQSSYQSPNGGTFHSGDNYHAVPQLFYTFSPNHTDFSFGLGFYSPFGLSSQWPQDTGFRTVATQGKITCYTINPVVAWRVATNFSIAAGVTANYSQLDLQQGLVYPFQDSDLFRIRGDGWAAGYNLGALWKIDEKVSVGATFRSSVNTQLQGHTDYYVDPIVPSQNVSAQADFPYPLKAIVGISYRPTPKWNLEFNADYTDWSQLGTITVHQQHGFPPLNLPADVPIPLNWESSWSFEFGATHYFDNGWLVSAGYIFNENSVPNANYNPLVADLNRHFFSAGVGYRGARWDFDLAYQFGYGPTRTVTGSGYSQAPVPQTADGNYDFISHALALSVGLHF